MPTFNPGLVTVYEKITDLVIPDADDVVSLNGVLVNATTENLTDTSGANPLTNRLVHRLHFTMTSFIYLDLSNDASILEFRKGPVDFLTGRETTHIKMTPKVQAFCLPLKNNPAIVIPWQPLELLKFALQGLTPAKILGNPRIAAHIAGFNAFRAMGAEEVDTPSGTKIAFVKDPLFKIFVDEAHS